MAPRNIRGYLRETVSGPHKREDEDDDEHENEAVARMNIDNYFSKFAIKRAKQGQALISREVISLHRELIELELGATTQYTKPLLRR